MARRRSPGDFHGGIDIDPFGMDSGSGSPADDRSPMGGYHDKGENDGLPTDNSHGSQTPRERVPPPHMPPPPPAGGPSPMGQGPASGGVATPQMPMYPSPQAGSTSMATGGASTDQAGSTAAAFHPLPSPAMGMMTSARRSLYGKAGGLLGGGLGAQDTTSNNVSDPISSLIQILQKRQGGF
jgi:hypothetical protein